MALPFINIAIGDLKKDTDLLSPAAFGAYMRLLLFHMHEAKNRGIVTFTLPQLCRIFAANDLSETQHLLDEIVNPAFGIVDYEQSDKGHCIINRRMVKEFAKSLVRSESGKKGAEVTNTKNRQNKKDADVFAAANDSANTTANNTASTSANDSAKGQQIYNNNYNNNTDEFKGGPGENDLSYMVPALNEIVNELHPKYIFRKELDFKPLFTIGSIIAEQLHVDYKTSEGVEAVKENFKAFYTFVRSHRHFKEYQISQLEKYFQTICIAMQGSLTEGEKPKGKPSILQTNVNAAEEAKNILKKKNEQKT